MREGRHRTHTNDEDKNDYKVQQKKGGTYMAGVKVKISAIDELSAAFDRMTSAGERALEMFERLQGTATGSFDTVNREVESMTQTLNNATGYADAFTDALDEMGSVSATEIEHLSGMEDVMDAVTNQSTEAEKAISEFGETSERAGEKAEDFGDTSKGAVVGLADVLATVGIVAALDQIVDAFSECSEAAAEFETNVTMISTVADTTILSTDEMAAQIKDLSGETARSVNELADATYNAISAGVDTSNAVLTVEEATKLATSGFTSSSTAMSVLTTAMNAYKMEASEITDISDSLIVTQNMGVVTIDQLAHSMGKAISTASAYGVNLYNLESGYISLTLAGINAEDSTTYLSSMMNELGSASSDVAKVLVEETGQSFGQLMEDGYSLGDVLSVLYDSVDQNSEAMMNLWGSAEAGKASNAIINQGLETFNENLNILTNSTGITQKSYEAMTNTAAFSTERLNNSFDNLSIAIGEDLNPAVSDFKHGLADMVDGFTDLVEEHPAISAVLTGITVGVGAVTLGVTAYTAATKIATVVSTAFGTAVNAAIWPLTLAAAAIAGVTAAVVYFADEADDMERVMNTLTASSQEQYEELQELEAEYQALVDAGEADTVAAYQLKNEIDELTESFEANKETIGDLTERNEQLRTAMDEVAASYEEAMDEITQSESDAKSLIAQLAAMSETSELSGEQLDIMRGIVDRLNGSYEGLNLTLDETNGKLNMSIEELWEAVTAEAEAQKAQANMDNLMGYLAQYQEAQKLYQDTNATMIAEKDKLEEIYDDITNNRFAKDHPILNATGWAKGAEMNYYSDYGDQHDVWEAAKTKMESARDSFEKLEGNIRACYEAMGYTTEEIDEMMAELAMASAAGTEFAESMENSAEAQISCSEAVEEAVGDVQTRLKELATDYDAVYTAAYDSINGQIGLFDTMKTESEQSVTDMQAALESQVEYLNLYSENLQKASEYGLSETLISSLSDGSAESAGQLDAIITKIEELGGTTEGMSEDAQNFVDSFNSSFEQVETAKENWANSVAQMETDFESAMDEINADMEDAVKKMEMAEDARANVISTMDAYIEGIKSKIPEVNSALAAITWANGNMDSFGLNGYAVGTSNAEPGLALVGENGPEIVDFSGGERVYTADETADILSSRGGNSDFYVAPASTEETSEVGGDKTITLKLEGAGEMKVGGGGMSKEAVVDILIENVKDVLMGIIQQEILEEGDLSYEF